MKEISDAISEGARAFLMAEYKILVVFVIVLFVLIGVGTRSIVTAICFVAGAAFSTLAGYFGMQMATKANVRTANAAMKSGMNRALSIAFSGGAVMGLCVAGLGVLGVSVIYLITGDIDILSGFSFGASSIALFARVGGGIYTKAADVGADLVGKVEAGIPEDDPRNPATIADNVGDNVGDVAGMGADLFDSNVAAMTSALVIAQSLGGQANTAMVFCYAALGLIASIIGIATARIDKGGSPTRALNASTYVTTGLFIVLTALATLIFRDFSWRIWGASTVGLLVGVIIGITTDYFTDDSKPIVQKVARASRSGSAFTVLSGSMESEIPKGSLVVTKQVDPSELQIGDDITYLSNPTTTITHRIVGITENYADTGQRAFTTQGVMNSAPDKQPVPAANVVGKVMYHSLFVGRAVSFLKEHWLVLLVLAVLLLGLLRALKVAFGKDGTDTEDGLKKPARGKIRQGAIHRRGEKT